MSHMNVKLQKQEAHPAADKRTSASAAPVSAAQGHTPWQGPRGITAVPAGNSPRMPARRWTLAWAAGLVLLCMLVPALLVQRAIPQADEQPRPPAGAPAPPPGEAAQQEPRVHVYLTSERAIETVTLEQYVRGVLAAEMPIDFELEALKAQAIAARTYIVRRLAEQDLSGVPVKGAQVTDTVTHQAYISQKKLGTKWDKTSASRNLARLNRAVEETRGMVMTYQGKPIQALFFSTSNGYTENSEDYWNFRLPYLRSVASPWDRRIAPHFQETVKLPLKDFLNKLDAKSSSITVSSINAATLKVLATTQGRRIKEIRIGNRIFTGREVREKLGLRSSQFTWRIQGDEIHITTYGNGHGVGMSQWGANGMAQEGAAAEVILQHYYTGVAFQQASKIAAL